MKRLFYIGLSMLLVLLVITGFNASHDDNNVADAVPIQSEEPQLINNIGDNTILDTNSSAPSEVKTPIVSAGEKQNRNTNETIVDKSKNIPQSKYRIDVNITDQKICIYESNKLIKEWIASTGKNNSTPLGQFTIQNRGEWFFSNKYQQGAMWWVSFKDWGVYLFHSIPMDSNKNILSDEAKKLGDPASHGCVRLSIDNAEWIYDNIPEGTPVYIHK